MYNCGFSPSLKTQSILLKDPDFVFPASSEQNNKITPQDQKVTRQNLTRVTPTKYCGFSLAYQTSYV